MSIVGTAITCFIGGWDRVLLALICLMAADWLFAVIHAAKTRNVNPVIGFWGFVNKVLYLLLVGIAHQLDLAGMTPEPLIRTALCWGLIGNEGMSVIKNAHLVGLWVPEWLINIFDTVKTREGGKINGG